MTERLPTVFFTLSPADLHWRDFHRHLPGKSAYLDKKIPHDNPARMRKDARQRAEAVKNHPTLMAWLFQNRVTMFLEDVLEPLWHVSDYWYRKEYQGRGSDHVHGFLWCRRERMDKGADYDLPDGRKNVDSPSVDELMKAVEEVMQAEKGERIPDDMGEYCRRIADWVAQKLKLECNHPAMYRSKWRGGENCEVPTDNVLRQTFSQMAGCRNGQRIPSADEMAANLDDAT